jgi:hypothetical protein
MSETLHGRTEAELAALFCEDRPLAVPTGQFRGELLAWIDSPASRHLLWRPMLALMFGKSPFGVDFDSRRWMLASPRFKLGHFEAAVDRSAFQPARVVALRYHLSRLPGLVKGMLYDEVQPLGPDQCLGIGGLVLEGTRHPAFWFALERHEGWGA